MSRVRRVVALALAPLVVVGIAVLATGSLYLLRGHVPGAGPAIGDALPLDELPRQDGVPLWLFVAVWTVAAVLLGVLARTFRVSRPTAAILLALGVGAWTYLETAVSLLVVRQVPTAGAFRAAAGLTAVYLPALLAGLGGALLANNPTSRERRAMRRTAYAGALLIAATVILGVVIAAPSVL
jgi:hypothetical protein